MVYKSIWTQLIENLAFKFISGLSNYTKKVLTELQILFSVAELQSSTTVLKTFEKSFSLKSSRSVFFIRMLGLLNSLIS